MTISDEAVETAARAICVAASLTKWEDHGPLTHDVYRIHARAALEAAAPHMQPDLLEEWAVQFSSGGIEESEDEAAASRRLREIRECIADGIKSPTLEPMRIVQRYRVASTELTGWKERTNPYRSQA